MSSREDFEKAAMAHNIGVDMGRLGDSYADPVAAVAWRFWTAAQSSAVRKCVDIAEPCVYGDDAADAIRARFPEVFKGEAG